MENSGICISRVFFCLLLLLDFSVAGIGGQSDGLVGEAESQQQFVWGPKLRASP